MSPQGICRAIGCQRSKVVRGSHCVVHEQEWFKIEAFQRDLINRRSPPRPAEVAELRARRKAMGMVWPPRNMPELHDA